MPALKPPIVFHPCPRASKHLVAVLNVVISVEIYSLSINFMLQMFQELMQFLVLSGGTLGIFKNYEQSLHSLKLIVLKIPLEPRDD